jgi:hypothetical protein
MSAQAANVLLVSLCAFRIQRGHLAPLGQVSQFADVDEKQRPVSRNIGILLSDTLHKSFLEEPNRPAVAVLFHATDAGEGDDAHLLSLPTIGGLFERRTCDSHMRQQPSSNLPGPVHERLPLLTCPWIAHGPRHRVFEGIPDNMT